MQNSSPFSETIERLVRQLLTDSSPDPLGLRIVVGRAMALPVLLDIGGCYSVRPSGQVISFGWDTPDDIQVETSSRIRNLAIYQGSKKYPELREFIPIRPTDAVTCPHCEGKGELLIPLDNLVCYCGGVGWLTHGEPLGML